MSFHPAIAFALTLLSLSPTVGVAQGGLGIAQKNQGQTLAQICRGYKDDLGGTLIANESFCYFSNASVAEPKGCRGKAEAASPPAQINPA